MFLVHKSVLFLHKNRPCKSVFCLVWITSEMRVGSQVSHFSLGRLSVFTPSSFSSWTWDQTWSQLKLDMFFDELKFTEEFLSDPGIPGSIYTSRCRSRSQNLSGWLGVIFSLHQRKDVFKFYMGRVSVSPKQFV